MNKQNKKIAQEKRRIEREKAEKRLPAVDFPGERCHGKSGVIFAKGRKALQPWGLRLCGIEKWASA